MIEPAALLAWSALALAVTLTPGPDTLLVASHAARGGVRAGLAAVAGIAAGIVYYASLIGFGFLSFLAAIPIVFIVVKAIGALYLLWLGVNMITRALTRAADPVAEPQALNQPFMQGFLTNALNPKVALFYLAALPQFATGSDAPPIGVMLLGIHAALGVIWLSAIVLMAVRARRIAWNPSFTRWLEGATGVFFVGVAGRLALVHK